MIPVNVITGFLGSGKSTILNALLKLPDLADTAVIVNEFGEVGIDHQLIESAIDQTVLLENGCVCCEVRGDLIDTLELMESRVKSGAVPAFRRVILETTGLADPAPILQTLLIEPRLVGRYRLGRVAATIDAVNGRTTLAEFIEAKKQVAVADVLILTKTDLAEGGEAQAVESAARALNPRALVHSVVNGVLDAELAGLLAGDDASDAAVAVGADMTALHPISPDLHGHDHDGASEHTHGHDHTDGISTASLVLDRPLNWRAFARWVESITSLRGPDLLRVKGIVNVAGRAGPVVIHGVQHVFHPPIELARWPDEDHRSRIVFIARNVPAEALARSLEAFEAEAERAG